MAPVKAARVNTPQGWDRANIAKKSAPSLEAELMLGWRMLGEMRKVLDLSRFRSVLVIGRQRGAHMALLKANLPNLEILTHQRLSQTEMPLAEGRLLWLADEPDFDAVRAWVDFARSQGQRFDAIVGCHENEMVYDCLNACTQYARLRAVRGLESAGNQGIQKAISVFGVGLARPLFGQTAKNAFSGAKSQKGANLPAVEL